MAAKPVRGEAIMEIKSIFRPTVPKIALYAALSFAVPGVLKICTTECTNKLVPFAGYRLILNPEQYVFTFPMMIVMFITSYIAASLIASFIRVAMKRGGWQKPKV